MSKKVVIVLPTSEKGGAEEVVKKIVVFLKDRNYQFDIFFLWKGDLKSNFWSDLDMQTNLYHPRSKNKIISLLHVIKIISFKKYEYSLTSHVLCSSLLSLLCVFRLLVVEKKTVRESTTIFSRYKGVKLLYYKFLYFFCYHKISLIINQTDFMKGELLRNAPYLQGRASEICVIPNPVNFEFGASRVFYEMPNEFIADRDKGRLLVVTAGRLIHEKGYDLLIDAVSQLRSKNNLFVKLYIYGEGPLLKYLKEKVRELGLNEEIIFGGYRNNLDVYFQHADVCVVSSRIEGFPNVLLQMMYNNTNVVSTRCAGGIQDIPGLITIPTNDVNSLSESLLLCGKNRQTDNRYLFDEYLKSRDISVFVETLCNRIN